MAKALTFRLFILLYLLYNQKNKHGKEVSGDLNYSDFYRNPTTSGLSGSNYLGGGPKNVEAL